MAECPCAPLCARQCPSQSLQKPRCEVQLCCCRLRRNTMRDETNSNDFGGFWNELADSNSTFVAAKNFFERFEFLVCSKFNHTQCGRTCACAVCGSQSDETRVAPAELWLRDHPCPALPVPRVRLPAGDEQRGLARDAEVRHSGARPHRCVTIVVFAWWSPCIIRPHCTAD